MKRRSPQYIAAEKRLGMHAVCCIGYLERVVRYHGDNHGGQAIKIKVTTAPEKAAEVEQRANPYWPVGLFDFVWVRNDVEGRRIKAWLDEALTGTTSECVGQPGWRECDDVRMTWELLLSMACQEMDIQFYSPDERERMVRFEMERVSKISR